MVTSAEGTLEVYCPPGQPWAPHWYPDDVLEWDPRDDPDARFNRSVVPLAPRCRQPRFASRPTSRTSHGRVYSGAVFGHAAHTPAQGSPSAAYYAFGFWQYVDTLVYWGGSGGDGLILAPAAPVTDAAHRNGVKVYGNVYFPEADHGDRPEWLHQFVVKDARGDYPVARQLVRIARYYGFDGWFINQESPHRGDDGQGALLAKEFQCWITHLREVDPGLECMWYDSMTKDGRILWQDELNAENVMFFRDGDTPVAHSIFLNYGWNSKQLRDSVTCATEPRRYDVAAGLDVEAGKFPTNARCDAALAAQRHVVSVALFRPDWNPTVLNDPEILHAKELELWAKGNADWNGMAHYVAEHTPVVSLPFVTNFNAGHGNAYWARGVKVSSAPWNNLSLQDVLPTYRTAWTTAGAQKAGGAFAPALDLGDAYEGGSSVRLRGALAKGTTTTHFLYQCSVKIGADTRITLVVKSPTPTVAAVGVVLTTDDGADTVVDFAARPTTTWSALKAVVPAPLAGRTLTRLGIRVVADQDLADYAVSLGQLVLRDGDIPKDHQDPPEPPKEVAIRCWRVNNDPADPEPHQTARLSWQPVNRVYYPVHHYEVYRKDGNGGLVLLAATPNSVCFVPRVAREGAEDSTVLHIASVTAEGRRSSDRTGRSPGWACTEVPWA
ncbi:hypothetical protein AB0A74_05315 [Saccharothrix sp. NPDC042600]|uniref:endo-beta-N-acetylglucosaminidase n=1 Tax=Saccharothrix TaxID=2071 RepID=UPI0033EC51EB|nr:hypothetical protein GCM10017745_37190 [Saccharothrix mutabilis subsp. capreolus]